MICYVMTIIKWLERLTLLVYTDNKTLLKGRKLYFKSSLHWSPVGGTI